MLMLSEDCGAVMEVEEHVLQILLDTQQTACASRQKIKA